MSAPKTVLCYGDSNTWGFRPDTKERFDEDTRWPGVLRNELGGGFRVIEEGLNGRTTVWDDPIEEHRNGKRYLMPCLLSHKPIELVVMMLGTNDLKKRFSVSAFDIGRSIGVLLEIIGRSASGPGGAKPRTLVISSPPVGKLSEFAEMFEGAREKSLALPKYFREHAELHGCAFFDAGEVIRTSDLDGIHYEAAEHGKLGRAVAANVQKILGT
jgi:lysophospholipase L1-like esterase